MLLAQGTYLEDRIYIKFQTGVDISVRYDNEGGGTIALTGISEIDELNYQNNCSEIERLFTGNDAVLERWYIFYMHPKDISETKQDYEYLSDYVESSDLVEICSVGWVPNDPMFDNTYHKAFFDSKIPNAWDIQQGNSNLLIGIIDNGLDWNHPDISIDNIWQNLGEDYDNDGSTIYIDVNGAKQFDTGDLNGIDDDGNGRIDDLAGYNFVNYDHNIYSNSFYDRHGLNMFGLIAAEENNSQGAAGSSFNSKIIHIKAGANGGIYGNWVQAIEYLANQNADIISMSFFSTGYMQTAQDAINYAYNQGSFIVACGGYTQYPPPPASPCPLLAFTYPASYENVVALGILESDAINMRLSSYVSPKIDLLGSRTATYPDKNLQGQHIYTWSMHTSGSTAMTAGILSLLRAQYPTWTNDQIINQLFITAINLDDYNTNNSCNFDFTGLIGHGLVDAEFALLFNGTVDRNLIWNKDIKVYHSIVVQSGKTLTIKDGTNLFFEPNKTFNVYGNLIIKGDLTINRTINILSGGSLTIEPGAKITLNDNAQILVNGQISCVGTSSNPIELDFVQAHSTYDQGVNLNYGCTSASFDYTTIKNSRYGIKSDRVYFTFYHGVLEDNTFGIYSDRAKPNIQFNYFNDCVYGVRLQNTNYVSGTETQILFNDFSMTLDLANSSAIYLYYSNPEIRSNNISGYINGISCNSYSAAKLGKEYQYGYNNIYYNDYGLTSANSNPFLGALYTGGPTNGRYNCLYDNYAYNISAASSSTILAYGNWWGSAKESDIISKLSITGGSSINYGQWLSSCPETEMSLKKDVGEAEYNTSASEFTPSLNPIFNPILDSIIMANQLLRINVNQGRLLLMQLISNHQNTQGIDLALDYLWESFNSRNELIQFSTYLNILSNRSGLSHLIGNSKLIRAKFIGENLISNLNEIISTYADTDVETYALYEKFVTYYFVQNLKDEALLVYEILNTKYPNSDYTKDASLVLFGPNYIPENIKLNKTKPVIIEAYSLSQNYPNPFNPSTSISFTIKSAGFVSLKVYDILGSEVAELVNEVKDAGYYSVEFNASALPSGVYVYKLQAGSFINSKKMILLK
jgi:hypothetical protein